MQRKTKWFVAGAVVAIVGGAGIGTVAASSGGDDDGADVPITGDALDKASAAALDHTGGGSVTETEVGDEDGFYEVEVTLEGGNEIDVHLDEEFNVLGTEDDGHGGDDSGPDDD